MTNNPKIKLLVFIPTLECGGMEKYVSLVCDHINTDIFDVTLVVLNNRRPFFKLKNGEVKIIDLKLSHVRFAIFKIRSTIKKNKPDIVFTTGNHLNLYVAIFRRFIPAGIKVIARETSIVSVNNKRARFPVLYDWLTRKFYSNLDFIISQSAYMEKDLVTNYNIDPANSEVIYNPVESFSGSGRKTSYDKTGTRKFLTVARLSEEKGIRRLISAVALLKMPYTYYITGEGTLRESLLQQIRELKLEDRIFLTGRKEQPFDGMEDADLFLMGSHYEGLGNVLLEAGAVGIPVVAFDAPGGFREIITDGENGLLVNDNDIPGFATAIEKALSIEFDKNKIIGSTQKRFSIDTIIKKLESLLLKLEQE